MGPGPEMLCLEQGRAGGGGGDDEVGAPRDFRRGAGDLDGESIPFEVVRTGPNPLRGPAPEMELPAGREASEIARLESGLAAASEDPDGGDGPGGEVLGRNVPCERGAEIGQVAFVLEEHQGFAGQGAANGLGNTG